MRAEDADIVALYMKPQQHAVCGPGGEDREGAGQTPHGILPPAFIDFLTSGPMANQPRHSAGPTLIELGASDWPVTR